MIIQIQRQISKLSFHAGKLPKIFQKRFKPYFTFTKATISNPRAIGAACPSSPFLARAMAQQVDANINNADGFVIELGGGTGMITRALLKQGIPPEKLITVEYSPELAQHLREEFPEIHVLEGDAGKLDQLLEKFIGKEAKNVHAIVSGLPLRSLPKSNVKAIKQQIFNLIGDNGLFIQFTYDLRLSFSQKKKFELKKSRIVWRNIPPARVNTYIKREIKM